MENNIPFLYWGLFILSKHRSNSGFRIVTIWSQWQVVWLWWPGCDVVCKKWDDKVIFKPAVSLLFSSCEFSDRNQIKFSFIFTIQAFLYCMNISWGKKMYVYVSSSQSSRGDSIPQEMAGDVWGTFLLVRRGRGRAVGTCRGQRSGMLLNIPQDTRQLPLQRIMRSQVTSDVLQVNTPEITCVCVSVYTQVYVYVHIQICMYTHKCTHVPGMCILIHTSCVSQEGETWQLHSSTYGSTSKFKFCITKTPWRSKKAEIRNRRNVRFLFFFFSSREIQKRVLQK